MLYKNEVLQPLVCGNPDGHNSKGLVSVFPFTILEALCFFYKLSCGLSPGYKTLTFYLSPGYSWEAQHRGRRDSIQAIQSRER